MKNKEELKSCFESDELYLGEYVKNKIDQLDEPETLSPEWIDYNRWQAYDPDGRTLYWVVSESDLEEVLVPKKELPMIPKFVSEWIEEMKQEERPLYSVMSTLMNKTNHEWAVWKSANKNFSEIVAWVWLNGFTAEEEPKQELPVIPQFVAKWIEGNKQFEEKWNDYSEEDAMNDTIHFTIYGLFADYSATNSHVELRKPVLEWLSVDRGNYFKLANAVQYGYEVEEEQKYIVKLPLPGNKANDFAVVDVYGDIWTDDEWPSQCKMTEKEIKALPKGEAYFEHFAVKVEEME